MFQNFSKGSRRLEVFYISLFFFSFYFFLFFLFMICFVPITQSCFTIQVSYSLNQVSFTDQPPVLALLKPSQATPSSSQVQFQSKPKSKPRLFILQSINLLILFPNQTNLKPRYYHTLSKFLYIFSEATNSQKFSTMSS